MKFTCSFIAVTLTQDTTDLIGYSQNKTDLTGFFRKPASSGTNWVWRGVLCFSLIRLEQRLKCLDRDIITSNGTRAEKASHL